MKKWLYFLFVLLVSGSFASDVEAERFYERISGSDRIETAISISDYWETSEVVILARADQPADALAAASLAGVNEAPILLTHSTSLPASVEQRLHGLQSKVIYILGGPNAISTEIENTLKQKYTVKRIAGASRFETAAAINKEAGTSSSQTAIIANGLTVADALSASSESAINEVPIYLSRKDALPVQLPAHVTDVVIYGGTNAISSSLEKQMKDKGIKVERIAGENRLETNYLALNRLPATDTVILVRGTSVNTKYEDYPDAVAASGLARITNAPIILTEPTKVNEYAQQYLAENIDLENLLVLGGENAVKSSIVEELLATPNSTLEFVWDDNTKFRDVVLHPSEPFIYGITETDNSVYELNYETGDIKEIPFNLETEKLYFSNGKLYVALTTKAHSSYWWLENQKGEVAIINSTNFKVEKRFAVNIDPFDMVVDNKGFIYITSGSGQWTEIQSYSSVTGAMVDGKTTYERSHVALSPNSNKIYTAETKSISPNDLSAVKFSEGMFTDSYDSPYHGDYRIGHEIKVTPEYVFTNDGTVFQSSLNSSGDLKYLTDLKFAYTDVAFNRENGHFYTSVSDNDYVNVHDYYSFNIEQELMTYGSPKKLLFKNGQLFMITMVEFEDMPYPVQAIEKINVH